MDDPSGDWTLERTEEFLTDRTIPIRLACHTTKGNLWLLSLWYRYRDGAIECATSASADVVRYLERDPQVAFEVSTNRPPYMGVRGAGTATLRPDDGKAVLTDLVERYLGDTDSEFAEWLLSPERDEVAIAVDVERASTWDFSDRMPAKEP